MIFGAAALLVLIAVIVSVFVNRDDELALLADDPSANAAPFVLAEPSKNLCERSRRRMSAMKSLQRREQRPEARDDPVSLGRATRLPRFGVQA